MLKNYVKIALRNLYRNKFYSILNIVGLGVAMAICVVGYVNYEFSQSYDSFHENADRIYTINSVRLDNGEESPSFFCPTPLVPTLADELPGVDNFCRETLAFGTMRYGDNVFSEGFTFLDPGFTEMFSLELLSGNLENFGDHNSIIISRDIAIKYFGEADPVGEPITLTFNDETQYDFVVGAVIENVPLNSCLYLDIAVPFERQADILDYNQLSWDDWSHAAFVQLNPETTPSDVTKYLQSYLPQTNAANERETGSFYMVPLRDVAAHQREASGSLRQGLHPAAIIAPSVTALLVLLLACFNFMNTSIAFAARRLKEIGIRKVIGGMRSQLVWQFLGENLILCLAALVLAVALAEIFVPAYDSLWPELALSIDYSQSLGLVGFLVGMLLFTGIAAGAYPAFFISALKPVAIFSGKQQLGGTNPLIRVLLTVQLALAMIAITAALILSKNADYIANFDPGYDGDGVLVIPFPQEGEYQILKNEILGHPAIQAVAGSRQLMGRLLNGVTTEFDGTESFALYFGIGEDYFEALGFTLLDGRVLDANKPADVNGAIMVNESLVRQNGWDTGVGKYMKLRLRSADSTQEYRVVGVVRDFQPNGVMMEVTPTVLRLSTPDRYRFISVKCIPENEIAAAAYVGASWKRLFPHRAYDAFWQSETGAGDERINNAIKLTFLYIALVTAVISAMGLFALVSLNIARRTKEIGIRKVLGAGLAHIGSLIVKEFVILVTLGSVLASVAAYFLMDVFLSSIWTYYCDFGVEPFVLSAVFIFALAILTVGYKVVAATFSDPVDALRNE